MTGPSVHLPPVDWSQRSTLLFADDGDDVDLISEGLFGHEAAASPIDDLLYGPLPLSYSPATGPAQSTRCGRGDAWPDTWGSLIEGSKCAAAQGSHQLAACQYNTASPGSAAAGSVQWTPVAHAKVKLEGGAHATAAAGMASPPWVSNEACCAAIQQAPFGRDNGGGSVAPSPWASYTGSGRGASACASPPAVVTAANSGASTATGGMDAPAAATAGPLPPRASGPLPPGEVQSASPASAAATAAAAEPLGRHAGSQPPAKTVAVPAATSAAPGGAGEGPSWVHTHIQGAPGGSPTPTATRKRRSQRNRSTPRAQPPCSSGSPGDGGTGVGSGNKRACRAAAVGRGCLSTSLQLPSPASHAADPEEDHKGKRLGLDGCKELKGGAGTGGGCDAPRVLYSVRGLWQPAFSLSHFAEMNRLVAERCGGAGQDGGAWGC